MGRQILRWLPGLVVVGIVLYTMSVYAALPVRMATHWGIDGRPNGWAGREVGAWLLPAIMAFMWGLFRLLPKIDSKKANYDKFGVAYDLTIAAILTFEALIQWAMLNIALGHPVDLNTIVYLGLGALFVILGLALPGARQNSDKVGGLLIAAAGIVTVIAALTAPPTTTFVVMLTATLTSAVVTIALSYLYSRRR
jgi:uncharacterized membrane protein